MMEPLILRCSAGDRDPFGGGGDDLRQPFGRRQPGKLGGQEPVGLGQFFIQCDFARNPACGERQNDEMPFDRALGVAGNRLRDSRQAPRV